MDEEAAGDDLSLVLRGEGVRFQTLQYNSVCVGRAAVGEGVLGKHPHSSH